MMFRRIFFLIRNFEFAEFACLLSIDTASNIGVSIISLHEAGDYHKKNGRRM